MDIHIARQLTTRYHWGQMYGDKTYMYHLEKVIKTLKALDRYSEVNVCVAYLHDILEDTTCTVDDLTHHFGTKIVNPVLLLTREKDTRFKSYLECIRTSKTATLIKLCVRYVNMQECLDNNSTLGKKYLKEYSVFREVLYEPQEHKLLWSLLDKVSKKLEYLHK
ncbi:MAG: putative GTP pyrophosphokinase [Prokaryotic dsDNA virus sp.]|jgi:(p)ppGpp synthase/HD superfamily hydrolase|nr:hypothetical protein [Flavobacteriaceae bacterium]QDP68338.1 MAG: putative GTP pyrophosphokinase [Prokaryotic dsDNA virus sp.]|tara:strand:- start:36983 stop:37474 length:492 start_codon:yes stop_codon:yes gene_type:complete